MVSLTGTKRTIFISHVDINSDHFVWLLFAISNKNHAIIQVHGTAMIMIRFLAIIVCSLKDILCQGLCMKMEVLIGYD